MTVQKKILVPNRVRHPADGGFSWIDRRFLREFSERLSGDAVFLYLFLTAVSDKHGLSFYSDGSIARQLRIRIATVGDAREELIRLDLVAGDDHQKGDHFRRLARIKKGSTPRLTYLCDLTPG